MRKHRIFGVVIAALLGTGALTQHASAHAGNPGVQLVSHTTPSKHAPGLAMVHTQGFTIRSTDVASSDRLIGLSTDMKPLPPITPPAPKPAPPAPPAPKAAPAPAPAAPSGDVWAALRQCESSGNYADNTGNGYYGAYQFSEATWQSLGLSGLPSDAPPSVQDAAAQRLQARSGWGQWPVCARRLGLI